MIELTGKYNSCKIFTETIDSSATGQLIALMNQEVVKESKIRIMPDVTAGKGSTVGTTLTFTDKIIPNIVGSDIGCGILCIKLKEKRIDLPKFDSVVNNNIPSGADINKESKESKTSVNIEDLRCYKTIAAKENYCYRSIGTLGGGNHFIELDKDTDGNLYLLIHSGSRNLGTLVCNYYQKAAFEECKENNIPFELSYVSGISCNNYLHDMKMVQKFAKDNRFEIARVIMKMAKLHEVESFDTIHNYVNVDNHIIRKGAISAQDGEKVIIPMNMRDGALICIGKGNPDWNYSAPHGAGRLLSRSDAKQTLGMKYFKESMKGIYSTSIHSSTLDESPMVYKPMHEIVDKISETVDIVETIKPIYNFKAHSV